jgi:selenocysteine lyase/cysteine desulfurase
MTRVISVSHVITSTGLRMPVREIVALARSRNILTIIDGAQAVGNIEVDVKAIGCDAYAAPGHKWLMAPKGTGFLYIRKEAASQIQPVEWTEKNIHRRVVRDRVAAFNSRTRRQPFLTGTLIGDPKAAPPTVILHWTALLKK